MLHCITGPLTVSTANAWTLFYSDFIELFRLNRQGKCYDMCFDTELDSGINT